MSIVFLLIPVSLILITLGVVLFSWAVKNGQYDDLDGPAHRILHDEDEHLIPEESRQPDSRDTQPSSADQPKKKQ